MSNNTPTQPEGTTALVDELLPCWTCCGQSYAEVHDSHQFPHTLYRCVNCKAVYPNFALRTPAISEEAAARAVYEHWQFGLWARGDKPAWIDGGNSVMQDLARALARAALSTPATKPDEKGDEPPREGLEQAGWDWLDQTVSAICDEHPSDIAYSADQMIDAFVAGAHSALRASPGIREAVLEEAAKVADRYSVNARASSSRDMYAAVARSIRALTTTGKDSGGAK